VVVLVKLPCFLCDAVQSGMDLLTFLNASKFAQETSVNIYTRLHGVTHHNTVIFGSTILRS